MNCTICNSENTVAKFFVNNYGIIRCCDCNHFFTDYKPTPLEVTQIYSDDYFYKGGAGYADYTTERSMLIKRGEYYADKMSLYMKPGKVLDIGAAAGFLLKGFENKSWSGTGIEPNKLMVNYGKNNLGVDLIQGTIETIELNEKFDLIIIIQVIAHLYDLKNSINKLSHLLKPNGQVLIETWDKDSFTAKIFGKHWHEFSPPSTLNYFSKTTLKQLMNQHGYSIVNQGIPKKSIHSKHAKSLITHKISESKRFKWMNGITFLIPGNIILPYPSEDLFWALFKKTN